jgi:hypothetical protein
MTAPLRTSAQFLVEAGFGSAPETLSFPEYPDINAQLAALRKLDPRAREISWVEYSLGRARDARLQDNPKQEAIELGIARKAVEDSFKRRTPAGQWPKLLIVLGLLGLIGILFWMDKRRKQLRRRRQNTPTYLESEADDEGVEDEDDE